MNYRSLYLNGVCIASFGFAIYYNHTGDEIRESAAYILLFVAFVGYSILDKLDKMEKK